MCSANKAIENAMTVYNVPHRSRKFIVKVVYVPKYTYANAQCASYVYVCNLPK
jgi:hypothetical protein